MTFDKRTDKQKADFNAAVQAGIFRNIALNNGGTGDLRRELTPKDKAKKKARRAMAKQSRKQNR
jgi:hypothetical protein